jgi:ATP-dependent Clp protease ATP-binding subunit ClpC
LLTSAVRRRPFAVVLFDEIEKAHPEVFDLLLQVLGEGRLSDALGRTVDFTNTLIILTSNLGVREAQRGLGFTVGDGHRLEVYAQAAQRFFRPEFFNRLDRIVPFDRLGREEVSQIAKLIIQDVLLREGLVRRKCVLRVESAALERIVDEGFDPVLGARALKRAIERQLAQPVAQRLSAGLPETITLINIYPGQNGVRVDVQGLVEVERLPLDWRAMGRPDDGIRGVLAALRRIEERFAHLRPAGVIDPGNLEGEHAFYFVVQDRVRDLRQRARELAEVLEDSRRPAQARPALPVSSHLRLLVKPDLPRKEGPRHGAVLAELAAAEDIRLFLEEMAQRARPFGTPEEASLLRLAEEVAVLETLAAAVAVGEEQVLLYVWTANPGGLSRVEQLAACYRDGFRHTLGVEQAALPLPEDQPERAVVVSGLLAQRLTAGEVGTHLFVPEHVGLIPVQVHAWRIPEGVAALEILEEHRRERRAWLEALARGEAVEDDPLRPGPVVRIYNEGKQWLDLRTGRVGDRMPVIAELVTATLPLPAEVQRTDNR